MHYSLLWSLIHALHIISVVLFVGGGTYIFLVLYPSLTLLSVKDRQSVQIQTLKRFFRGLMHGLPTMLITGWLLVLHEGGFTQATWSTNVMQAIGILVTLWFIMLYRGPYQKIQRALRPDATLFDTMKKQITLITALSMLAIISACLNYAVR